MKKVMLLLTLLFVFMLISCSQKIFHNKTDLNQDEIIQLVDKTELNRCNDLLKTRGDSDFGITASKIYGYYQEENKLKIFVKTNIEFYRLEGKILNKDYGSIVPAAITYFKDENGNYIMEQYIEAQDGSLHKSSIEEYSTMPVSNEKIKEIVSVILNDSITSTNELHRKHLIEYLNQNNLKGISLNEIGKIIPLT